METMNGPVNASDAESGVRRPMRTRSLARGQEKEILQNRGSLRAVAVLMNRPSSDVGSSLNLVCRPSAGFLR